MPSKVWKCLFTVIAVTLFFSESASAQYYNKCLESSVEPLVSATGELSLTEDSSNSRQTKKISSRHLRIMMSPIL